MRCKLIILLSLVMILAVNFEGHASSDKRYLNLLGEALAYREGSAAFLGECSNLQNGSLRIGSKVFLWDTKDGIRLAKDILRRSQICIDQMFPKALELGWISRAEWTLGLRQVREKNASITPQFRKYLLKNGVKTFDMGRGVCLLKKLNLDDIAKDKFC
jgi:hypothetical protein